MIKLSQKSKEFLETCKGEYDHPGCGRPIDINRIKKILKDTCMYYVNMCKKANIRVPRIDVLMYGNDPGSKSYVKMKKKAAEDMGIIAKVHHFTEQGCSLSEAFSIKQKIYTSDVVYNKLINEINECYNKNTACMVQLPVQNHRNVETEVLSRISGLMDVDGLNPRNRTRYIIDNLKII
ncbi:tetrahydrofolate dehydrogenase/cyclohydrolase catalytic domain-containing protein, partial [Arthrospira platensis SPKY2]